MSRARVSAKGSVVIHDGRWVARWYRYSGRFGEVRTRPKRIIGLVTEMTEDQAKSRMAEIIRLERESSENARRFAGKVVDWGSAKITPELQDRASRTGAIGEHIVIIDLLKKGYDVFRAASPSAQCDLIALRDKEMFRVEVKFVGCERPTIAQIRKTVERNVGNFDLLALILPDWTVRYVSHAVVEDWGRSPSLRGVDFVERYG